MTDLMTDPVCRIGIRLDQTIETTLFQGERLYFCSSTCYSAFLDTPHRYRGWASDRARGHVARLHIPGRWTQTASSSAP